MKKSGLQASDFTAHDHGHQDAARRVRLIRHAHLAMACRVVMLYTTLYNSSVIRCREYTGGGAQAAPPPARGCSHDVRVRVDAVRDHPEVEAGPPGGAPGQRSYFNAPPRRIPLVVLYRKYTGACSLRDSL
jgi:hypothetical protein